MTSSSTSDGDGGLDVMAVIAIEVIVAVAVWGLLGLLLDLVMGTTPWAQFSGVLAGTIVALVLSQRHATPPPEAGDGHG